MSNQIHGSGSYVQLAWEVLRLYGTIEGRGTKSGLYHHPLVSITIDVDTLPMPLIVDSAIVRRGCMYGDGR